LKKFLQICEMTGSLYGRNRPVDPKSGGEEEKPQGSDLRNSYNSFYKRQRDAMSKVFRRG